MYLVTCKTIAGEFKHSPATDDLSAARACAEGLVATNEEVAIWQLALTVTQEQRTVFREPNGREA